MVLRLSGQMAPFTSVSSTKNCSHLTEQPAQRSGKFLMRPDLELPWPSATTARCTLLLRAAFYMHSTRTAERQSGHTLAAPVARPVARLQSGQMELSTTVHKT